MKLHLDYKPAVSEHKISHADQLFLIGSCFSEHIAEKLRNSGFHVADNPYGILFNPLSISECLSQIISPQQPEERLLERGGLYYSYDCHSSVCAASEDELSLILKNKREESLDYLKRSKYLIITFGSAYVYELMDGKNVVANCHKQPSAVFQKRLLQAEEITELYRNLIKKLKALNPHLHIVFTVSPVKYLKDGMIENSVSKATLILAIHQLVKQGHAAYFPAYELVNDDLRDYRFYKEDMAHPNEQAIQYVWEKFSDTFFNQGTESLIKEMEKLNAAMNHKILFPGSEQAIAFQKKVEKRKEDLIQQHPYLKFYK
jgi:hypothetical protein